MQCEHRPLGGWLLRGLWQACLWELVSSPSALSSPGCAWASIHWSCLGPLWPSCINSLPANFSHCLGYVFLGIPMLWVHSATAKEKTQDLKSGERKSPRDPEAGMLSFMALHFPQLGLPLRVLPFPRMEPQETRSWQALLRCRRPR